MLHQEKRFENYFAKGIATVYTVLQQYLQEETIYLFQESFEGKRLCNDNFRFTEKGIPLCQEMIIVSIRLQRLCNDLIWRSSLKPPIT
jgi:hypothetical protein